MKVDPGGVAQEVESLLSWSVSPEDRQRAALLLVNDSNVNRTIAELQNAEFLTKVFKRIDEPAQRRYLLNGIARKLDESQANAARDSLRRVDIQESRPSSLIPSMHARPKCKWEMAFNIARAGAHPELNPKSFNRALYRDVLPERMDLAGTFTGSGATGINPTERTIPHQDKVKLAKAWFAKKLDVQDGSAQEMTQRYLNPLSRNMPAEGYVQYWQPSQMKTFLADQGLKSKDFKKEYAKRVGAEPKLNNVSQAVSQLDLSAEHDARNNKQARLLFDAPVSTSMPELYGDQRPQRSSIVRLAADKYRLEPELVAGVILAEQRDQSANEDAADVQSVLLANHDASIGLGQVAVSTARANGGAVLADMLSLSSRKDVTPAETAKLLSDDTVNIFATAAVLRRIADQGAQLAKKAGGAQAFCHAKLPDGRPNALGSKICDFGDGKWNGSTDRANDSAPVDMSRYEKHSKEWSATHIRLLGSEYTSAPWDGKHIETWADLVLNAYLDVKQSGAFKN